MGHPGRWQLGRLDAQGRGECVGVFAVAHRLVVDHVVDPRARPQRGHHGRCGVVMRDRGAVGVGRTGEHQPSLAQKLDHIEQDRGVRSVEAGEAEDDPGSSPFREMRRRSLGVQHGAVVARRLQPYALVDPRLAAVGVDQTERLLNESLDAPGEGRLDQMGGDEAADAVVLPPGPGEEHARARRDVGGQVADHVVAGDRATDGRGIEEVDRHRGRSHPLQGGPLFRRATDRRHRMPGRDQEGDGPLPDDSRCSGDENSHDNTRCGTADRIGRRPCL